MVSSILDDVKKKKIFAELPDNLILQVIDNVESQKLNTEVVKEVRAQLRKYFGVFLTNNVIKPKDILDYDSILKSHKSSSQRDYNTFYKELLDGRYFDVVFDLGCGVNGFSYPYLQKEKILKYIGIEASKSLVGNMNYFFNRKSFNAKAIWADLLNLNELKAVISSEKGKKVIFCFQLIDALEKLKRGYGHMFIEGLLEIISKKDMLIVSFPLKSMSGRRDLIVKRKWLVDFLKEKAVIKRDFVLGNERVLVIENL